MLKRIKDFAQKVHDEIESFFDPEVRKAIRDTKGQCGLFGKTRDVIWDGICGILYVIFRFFVTIIVAAWKFASQFCLLVNNAIEKESRWFIRVPLYAGYVFAPVAVLVVPIGVVVVFMTFCVFVDQITYPHFPVNKKFLDPQNSQLSLDRKSALIFEATTQQMNNELHSTFGWTPNDLSFSPVKFFDNRLYRQYGVRNATRKLIVVMSKNFTNYGRGDEENQYTHEAGAEMSSPPDYWNWYMGDSEDMYHSALDKINTYISIATASDEQKHANIKTDDLLAILWVIIDDVLREPLGKLQEKHNPLSFDELDDAVYYTQGSAIVARDTLVALRSTFHDALVKGSDDNLNYAINALNGIIEANPWCVWRGDDRMMFLMDTRAKFALGYNLAIERLKDTAESLKI